MNKWIMSTTVDPEIYRMIEEVARESRMTRSEVIRMILEVIRYIPPDKFRRSSPVAEFFVNDKGVYEK